VHGASIGCDEEAQGGWSDSDLATIELLCLPGVLGAGGGTSAGAASRTPRSGAIAAAILDESHSCRWVEAGQSMPVARGNPGVCRLPSGQLLVAAGEKGATELDTCLVYEPSSGQWQAWPDLQHAHGMARACFIPAERQPSSSSGGSSMAIPSSSSGGTGPGHSTGGGGGIVIVMGGHVVADDHRGSDTAQPPPPPGGWGNQQSAAAAAAAAAPPPLDGRTTCEAREIPDNLWRVGGYCHGTAAPPAAAAAAAAVTDTAVREEAEQPERAAGWSRQQSMPVARRAFAADVLLDGRVIVAGGATAGNDQLLSSVVAWTHARRFHPLRSILTEIYRCHTCSCHEVLRMETPGQAAATREPPRGGGGVGGGVLAFHIFFCCGAVVVCDWNLPM
jgi:hypothetical protein